MRFFWVLLGLLLGAAAGGAEGAEEFHTAHAELRLLKDQGRVEAGSTLLMGLEIVPAPHWHTYWRFAGDVGLPTRLSWTLPAGLEAGEMDWPTPTRFDTGGLISFGYDHAHTLLVPLHVSPGVEGPLAIALHVRYLVCEIQCVPEEASLDTTVAVGASLASQDRDRLHTVQREMPQHLIAPATGHYQGGQWFAELSGVRTLDALQFFPGEKSPLDLKTMPVMEALGDRIRLWGMSDPKVPWDRPVLSGLLVDPQSLKSWWVSFPMTVGFVPPLPMPTSPAGEPLSLGLAVLFAFVGGLILNLMPCVLPVLSLKVVGLIRDHPTPRQARHQGLAFLLGVLLSFWCLVALLLLLRSLGTLVGWGFQLQSPGVVAGLAILFMVLTLNFAGVFEWGGNLQALGGRLSRYNFKHPVLNSCLMGVLTTLVATPCTAPFLGAGIGYTWDQSEGQVFAVFTAMALGVAAPVTLATVIPGVLRLFPKPGAWMNRLKQGLAIPMGLTVVWLLWVLSKQIGGEGALGIAALLLLMGGVLNWRIVPRTWVPGIIGLCLVSILTLSILPQAPRSIPAHADWQAYSDERLMEARRAGQAVFIDFTAAWCLSCQLNLQSTLQDRRVIDAFRAHHVVLLEADWTQRDPTITRALQRLQRNALPVYALYRPNAPNPQLLPEVLTPETVLAALSALPHD